MGDIIKFSMHKPEPKRDTNRIKALMKGELETYTCDSCGADIEVAYNDKPERCPGCNRVIDWS